MKKYSFILLLFITCITQVNAQEWDKVYGEVNGMHVVMKDKKYGYVDASKKIVAPAIYEDAFDFQKSGYAKVQNNGKQGFIDKTGKIVVPLIYDEVYNFQSSGYAVVKNDEKKGCVNNTGKVIISIEYDKVYAFIEGYAIVFKNNKYGYANTTGEIIIPVMYDDAFDFKNGQATVVLNNKKGKITPEGKVTWGLSIGDYAHGGVVIKLDESGEHGVVCAIQDCGGEGKKFQFTDADFCASGIRSKVKGKMWRLPNWDEVKLMDKQHDQIVKTSKANGGTSFVGRYYWSSREQYEYRFNHYVGWIEGASEMLTEIGNLDAKHSVRAVRDF